MHNDEALAERFVFGVDIENYSGRNTRHQRLLQERLREILQAAARGAGLDPAEWKVQGEGDGQFAALPPGADLVRAVGAFVRSLDDGLRLHNEDHSADLELRLRIAMHCDVFVPSAFGTAGPAFVEVARLLAAGPARDALRRDRRASLVLLVSPEVFRKAVQSDLASLRERDFTEIQVSHPEKGYDRKAHMYLPHPSGRADEPSRQAPAPPPPSPSPPPGPPPGISYSGDGNRGLAFGNHVGGDLHIKVEEAARIDPGEAGMTAFRAHDYGQAADHLRRAAAHPENRQDAADLRFRLAVALLRGRRPRLAGRPAVQQAERELGKALTLEPGHAGALLLWAIVKQDFYEQNGFDYRGPTPERMVAGLVRAPLAPGPAELAAEIVEHIPAWENPIWTSLRAQVQPAGENG